MLSPHLEEQQQRRTLISIGHLIHRSLSFSIAWPCFIILVAYVACAIQGRLVWPKWYPSEVFDRSTGHIISSAGIPLTGITLSVFVLCRHYMINVGCSDRKVQRLNYASLCVMAVGIISMTGVSTVNYSLSPIIHYLFAGIFFLAFAIDTALHMLMMRTMEYHDYRNLRGESNKTSRYVVGAVVLITASVSLVGTALQSYETMSIGECSFLLFVFIFWWQDFQLLSRFNISICIAIKDTSDMVGASPRKHLV